MSSISVRIVFNTVQRRRRVRVKDERSCCCFYIASFFLNWCTVVRDCSRAECEAGRFNGAGSDTSWEEGRRRRREERKAKQRVGEGWEERLEERGDEGRDEGIWLTNDSDFWRSLPNTPVASDWMNTMWSKTSLAYLLPATLSTGV